MRPRLAMLLGAVLLAVVAMMALDAPDEALLRDRSPAPRDGASPTLRGTPRPDATGDDSGRAADPEDAEPRQANPSERAPFVRVRGTLHQLNSDGSLVAVRRGNLRIEPWGSAASGEQTVDVFDGTWSVEIPEGAQASVTGITIEGELAMALFDAPTSFGPDRYAESIALRAEVVKPTVLRIVDAGSGADLEDVTVVRSDGSGTWYLHPSDCVLEGVVIQRGDSPFELPIWDPDLVLREEVVWASAPGYAWAWLCFDMVAGGERRIALHPGGDLHVRLLGDPPPEDAWLRIRRAPGAGETVEEEEEAEVAGFRIGGRTTLRIDRLAMGSYVASVDLDRWGTSQRPLASSPFRIEAGRQDELVLRLATAARTTPVPVSGTVVIPSAWELREPRLRIELRGEAVSMDDQLRWVEPGDHFRPVADGAESWRFDLGHLPPGRAEIHLEGTGFRALAEIGPDSPSKLRLEVPPPARVSVRVHNARTGAAAEVDHLSWRVLEPDEQVAGIRARKGVEPGSFHFLAPVGVKAEISVDVVSALAFDPTVQVEAGGVEKAITIDPAGSVLVVLMDGDARLPHHAYAELLDGQVDRAIAWSDHDEGCVVYASQPGRLLLRLPELEGFAPIADREVLIQAGIQTRVTIQLVRSP